MKSEPGEEKCNLSLGRFEAIAAVNQVLGEEDAEIATNGARSGIAWVRRTDHRAGNLPSVLGAFDHCNQRRATSNELHQFAEEWLVGVFSVVSLGGGSVDRAQFSCSDLEVTSFETSKDFSDEASFDGVGFADNKRAIHRPNARPTFGRDAIRP